MNKIVLYAKSNEFRRRRVFYQLPFIFTTEIILVRQIFLNATERETDFSMGIRYMGGITVP